MVALVPRTPSKRKRNTKRSALATEVRELQRSGVPVATRSGELPKISQSFLEFAEPVLEGIADDAPLASYQGVLWFAQSAWNAASDFSASEDECLALLLRAVSQMNTSLSDEMQLVARILFRRRRTEFRWDDRLIGGVEVSVHDGELRVQVAGISRKG